MRACVCYTSPLVSKRVSLAVLKASEREPASIGMAPPVMDARVTYAWMHAYACVGMAPPVMDARVTSRLCVGDRKHGVGSWR